MKKIAIVVDSTSDLTQEIIDKYDIHVLPLQVIYAHHIYRDKIEISSEQVLKDMEREVPKTSLPLTADVIKLFDRLKEEKYTHVLGLFISSGLSGTYNMIRNIAKDYEEFFVSEILDSRTLSWGTSFGAVAAAKEREASGDFDRMIEAANEAMKNTRAMFVIPTLHYLKKGGRMGRVEGTVGDLLDIKPIVGIDQWGDGKYFTYKKVRGKKKSHQAIYDIAVDFVKDKSAFDVVVLHGGAQELAEEFCEKIKAMQNCRSAMVAQVTPVIGVHTGPGLIAFAVHSEEGLRPWK